MRHATGSKASSASSSSSGEVATPHDKLAETCLGFVKLAVNHT